MPPAANSYFAIPLILTSRGMMQPGTLCYTGDMDIRHAVSVLTSELATLDTDALDLPAENRGYLLRKLRRVRGEMQLYGEYLRLALPARSHSVPVVVDYGAGHGFMALLAKQVGCTVIYNDLQPSMAQHAQTLAAALGLSFDHIIVGEIDDLVAYTRQHRLTLDALVSHNALEHIYDVPTFLRRLADLPGLGLIVAVGSGANGANPHRCRKLARHHAMRELHGKYNWDTQHAVESERPYLDVRRDIIAAYAPDLPPGDIDGLAVLTRGLRQEDIWAAVDEWQRTGRLAYTPDGTNTCDPLTGNWAEHVMDVRQLRVILADSGFETQILAGRYVPQMSRLYNVIGPLLNWAIATLGFYALPVAPHYILHARRRQ